MRTGTSALRRRLSLATALLLAVAAGGRDLGAQGSRARQSARPVDENNVPAPAPARSGFDLFAFSDLAVTGLVYPGSNGALTFGMSNYGGPCSDAQALTACGWINRDGAVQQRIFEIVFTAGAPISEFRKVRAVYPGVNNVLGGVGYAQLSNADLLSRPRKFGPADNQVGRLFSGVATKQDGSCLDKGGFSGGYLNYGLSLLAISNCPPTWPASGFDGPRPVTGNTLAARFRAAPDLFHFEEFRVPKEERDQTTFLGNVSTYGETSDHYTEILRSYGSVTPKGTGAPTIGGFPLGLDIRFDAFNYGRPSLSSVVYYQVTVVNNSKDVYGTGIDYDSLYMGLSPGFTNTNSSLYYVPQQNALKVVALGVNGNCNGGATVPGVACTTTGFNTNNGFAIVVLKSPIGDTRNKLLSKPGAFLNPTSPFADDTITFNHGHICEFGASCDQSTTGANTRRGFGLMSSTEENVLAGDDPSAYTSARLWLTFRNKNYVNGQINPTFARFNRFVPTGTTNPKTGQPFGSWDYNNDGVADTLYLDSCAEQGCVAAFSDTLPGKQLNGRSQVGGQLNAGPFKLKSGDTTQFLYAFVGSVDSLGLENGVRSAIDTYMSFFLSPTAPDAPRIVSVLTRSSRASDSLGGLDPIVVLNFSNEPERFSDPFLAQYAADLASGGNGDPFLQALDSLNPDLADSIYARALPAGTRFKTLRTDDAETDSATATGNFADLLIFKSCDNGATFTATADCQSAPARDVRGQSIGLGYQAYAVITPDENGVFDKTFTDEDVKGGRTYLYSAVPRSRGFMAPVRILSGGVVKDTILLVADTISGSLATTGASTAKVYVPISLAAGSTAGSARVTTVAGTSTLPITLQVSETAAAGTYRVIFANQFRVTTVTTLSTGNASTTVVARRNYETAQFKYSPSAGVTRDTTVSNFAGDSVMLSGATTVDTTGLTVLSNTTTTNGDQRTQVVVYEPNDGLGFVLASPANVPYYISGTLSPEGSLPSSFLSRTDFPGFGLSLNQTRADTLVLERIVQTNGDTVPTQLRDNNAIQFREQSSERADASGLYQFVFKQDAFGPSGPFVLSDVPTLQSQVRTSLGERTVATTGDISARIRSKILEVNPALGTLAPIKFPFYVLTPRGDTAILAAQARAASTTMLFGTGVDTLRISAQTDVWVPGDPFYVLEKIRRDSVVGDVTIFGDTTINGQTVKRPIQVEDLAVSFAPAVLGCNTPRETCNPIQFGTRGATGYLPYQNGWKLVIDYPRPFTLSSELAIAITGNAPQQVRLTKAQLKQIRVVPNPYVVVSDVDKLAAGRTGDPRVIFTGVPQEGVLRVYSVSGQFLQQLTWTPADLNGTGDLAYDLRTREGLDLSSGLYIYVITAKGVNAGSPVARGKFVVIR